MDSQSNRKRNLLETLAMLTEDARNVYTESVKPSEYEQRNLDDFNAMKGIVREMARNAVWAMEKGMEPVEPTDKYKEAGGLEWNVGG